MKNIKQLLTSKRFGVAAAGVLFVILNEHMGLDLPMASIVSIVGIVIGFIVSQGSADKGKEAAKILTEKSELDYGGLEEASEEGDEFAPFHTPRSELVGRQSLDEETLAAVTAEEWESAQKAVRERKAAEKVEAAFEDARNAQFFTPADDTQLAENEEIR